MAHSLPNMQLHLPTARSHRSKTWNKPPQHIIIAEYCSFGVFETSQSRHGIQLTSHHLCFPLRLLQFCHSFRPRSRNQLPRCSTDSRSPFIPQQKSSTYYPWPCSAALLVRKMHSTNGEKIQYSEKHLSNATYLPTSYSTTGSRDLKVEEVDRMSVNMSRIQHFFFTL